MESKTCGHRFSVMTAEMQPRLVFDLETETPYEVIDDGDGQVRVRFGAIEDVSSDVDPRSAEAVVEETNRNTGENTQADDAQIGDFVGSNDRITGVSVEVPSAFDSVDTAAELDDETLGAEDFIGSAGADSTFEAFESEVLAGTNPVNELRIESAQSGGGVAAAPPTNVPLEAEEADPELPAAPVTPPALEEPLMVAFEPEPPPVGSVPVLEAAPPLVPRPTPIAETAALPAPAPNVFLGQPVQIQATPQYTGEIVGFDVRNLDLQDFFRLIGDLSGLNVILDPTVNGAVTMRLIDVPWDQALDVVLRNNNLGYELEGNILRVATQATLQAEEQARTDLREAQELNAELVTQTFILSYTVVATVDAAIQDLLSQRGSTIIDARRNALIITDVPSRFARVDSLISFLDEPSPQVEIEARLLSASRSFSRDLGVQIGLLIGNNSQNFVTGVPGAASPFLRTPTPSVDIGGALPLIADFPAGGTSGLSFLLGAGGDVLLDTIIQAAEARGTARLLSRPRVTTQNNQAATVSQGTQIPVQTNVNNTISVTFTNFSLSLTVTPRITEAGTILLDIAIENSTPDFGRSVTGIPSISTQQATTQVLIPDGGDCGHWRHSARQRLGQRPVRCPVSETSLFLEICSRARRSSRVPVNCYSLLRRASSRRIPWISYRRCSRRESRLIDQFPGVDPGPAIHRRSEPQP